MKKEALVPVVEDLSSQALERHVKKRISSNPLTFFPPVLGVIGLGALAILGIEMSSMFAIMGYLLVAIGPLNFTIDKFFRRDSYWHDYVKQYNHKLDMHSEEVGNYLISEFEDMQMTTCVEIIHKLRKFHTNFLKIIDDKFFSKESTSDRYLAVGKGLYVGALGKMQIVLSKYRSSRQIDPGYIKERLKRLKNRSDDDSLTEKLSLKKRLNLKEENDKGVNKLISEVESTLTSLADLSAQVAAIADATKEENFERIQAEAIRLAENTHLFTNTKQL